VTPPLAGIRVIDLTTNMSGPLATMLLADQGADVVKVESFAGDAIRSVGTGHDGMSAYFANNNRGKRSIAVDLATERGRDLVRRLVTGADVFAQNFRPGVIERLGLGADALLADQPRLVHASISGFGPVGPLAGAPAYDHVVQALAGFAALQAASPGEPALVRHGVVDKATAYTFAQAVTAALLRRATTGAGGRVDVSMLDVAVAFLWPDGMMDHTVDEPSTVLPPTSRSFRVSPTADGHVVLVTLTATQWSALSTALLADEGSGDSEMDDTAERMRGGAEVMRRVRARIATLPTAEVVDRLRAADVPVAPVLALDEVADHEQVVANGTVASSVRCARPGPRRGSTGPRCPPPPARPGWASTPTRSWARPAGPPPRSTTSAPPASSCRRGRGEVTVALSGRAVEEVKRRGVSWKPSCGGGARPPNRHAWAARTGLSARLLGQSASASARRPGMISPSSAGSQRSPLSTVGPRLQPRATPMRPPETRNTWPVTARDSGLPSHTTSGATFSGALRSKAPGSMAARRRPPPRFSVMRVRAPGAMALTVTP